MRNSVAPGARLPVLVVVWIVLAGIIHASQVRLHALIDSQAHSSGKQLIPAGKVVKFLSGGYEQLIADFWWLSFIQYFGDSEARKKDGYSQAYDFLNLITTLDPKFTQPYWFAAFAVGAEQKRPDLAAELIERGMKANQDSWHLPFIAGINQYLYAGNYMAAARYYRRAAMLPQAPVWLSRQARVLEANIPAVVKEAGVWKGIYESSEDPAVRLQARRKLVELWSEVLESSPGEAIRKKAEQELKYLNSGFNAAD